MPRDRRCCALREGQGVGQPIRPDEKHPYWETPRLAEPRAAGEASSQHRGPILASYGKRPRLPPAKRSSTSAVRVEFQLAGEPLGKEPQCPPRVGALGRDQMVADIPNAFRAPGERCNQAAAANFPLGQ